MFRLFNRTRIYNTLPNYIHKIERFRPVDDEHNRSIIKQIKNFGIINMEYIYNTEYNMIWQKTLLDSNYYQSHFAHNYRIHKTNKRLIKSLGLITIIGLLSQLNIEEDFYCDSSNEQYINIINTSKLVFLGYKYDLEDVVISARK
jgi:hypothetical protein